MDLWSFIFFSKHGCIVSTGQRRVSGIVQKDRKAILF